jgi:hypothetical protein
LPTELPEQNICRRSCRRSQICRRSQLFADRATAKAKFANGATYLLTEPQKYLSTRICRQSRRSQICRWSRRSQICHYRVLHVLLFVYFLTKFALLSLSCRQPRIDTIQSKLVFCTQPDQNLSFRRTSSQLQFPHSN